MWITSNAAFLDHSALVESSMERVMILLMNPSIEDSFGFMSTTSVSACNHGYEVGR